MQHKSNLSWTHFSPYKASKGKTFRLMSSAVYVCIGNKPLYSLVSGKACRSVTKTFSETRRIVDTSYKRPCYDRKKKIRWRSRTRALFLLDHIVATVILHAVSYVQCYFIKISCHEYKVTYTPQQKCDAL